MSLAGQMDPPGRQCEKLPQKAAEFVINPALLASRGNRVSPNSHYTVKQDSGVRIQESGGALVIFA